MYFCDVENFMTLRRIVEKRSLNADLVKIKTLSWLFYIRETKDKDRYLTICNTIKYHIYIYISVNRLISTNSLLIKYEKLELS